MKAKMKALRWYGIHDVRTEEIETPHPRAGEALIRVLYAGICGSDLHIYNKGMFIQNIPETMGHEFCGVVEEIAPPAMLPPGTLKEAGTPALLSPAACASPGSNANSTESSLSSNPPVPAEELLSPGDLVIANPMIPCGTCESCRLGSYNTCEALGFIGEVRQGCFAEYICLPMESLLPVPANADMEKMALAEPLAVAVNVCKRAGLRPDTDFSSASGLPAGSAGLRPETSLAIIGAGPIGLLTAAAAKTVYGVEKVTVVNRSETRRRIAAQLGADAIAALPDGQRFDRIVEAAGSPATLRIALEHTRAGGQVLPVSVFEEDCTIDANLIVGAQLTITGCNCYSTEDLREAIRLLASGRLDVSPIITDVMTLDDGKAAFEKLCAKEKSAAKILFRMPAVNRNETGE